MAKTPRAPKTPKPDTAVAGVAISDAVPFDALPAGGRGDLSGVSQALFNMEAGTMRVINGNKLKTVQSAANTAKKRGKKQDEDRKYALRMLDKDQPLVINVYRTQ